MYVGTSQHVGKYAVVYATFYFDAFIMTSPDTLISVERLEITLADTPQTAPNGAARHRHDVGNTTEDKLPPDEPEGLCGERVRTAVAHLASIEIGTVGKIDVSTGIPTAAHEAHDR
jgi:hypothetical protein